ncbi:MAG: alpha-E domain-containing protein [Actinomycetes bacterium]|jgi:uncharacterized alpha-E superfamily protein
MLARLAENLFWAGRYLERAEDTARMVDVTYHTLLESPQQEVAQAWEQLLDVLHLTQLYLDRHAGPDGIAVVRPERVIEFLVIDPDNPGSITASVTRARENGRSVRELISSELWEATNDLHLTLRARDLHADLADQPFELFRTVKQRCQTIAGVATETMPRDDAWRFLTLGRMLERAEMTCRLLNVRYGQLADQTAPVAFHHWVGVLKSVSALEAFRKRYRASMDPVAVVEFLLLSREFPRSVLFALETAERQLEHLGGGDASRARRILGRSRAALQYRDVGELMEEGLHHFLDLVQDRVHSTASAVADEFFRHTPEGTLHAIATS